MKIATILPTEYLGLEMRNDYHLCLAHLLGDARYGEFFKHQARKGNLVMMDNGVVETGEPMDIHELITLADHHGVHEMVLPDKIYSKQETLMRGGRAMFYFYKKRSEMEHDIDLVAVPQGADAREWAICVKEMLEWPVKTIGISRFIYRYFPSRAEALRSVPELVDSDKEIHLLGCPNDPREIYEVEQAFPGRVRGVDSGIAAMYTQVGKYAGDGDPKPDVELDFSNDALDEGLLQRNVEWWRNRCLGNV